MKQLIQQALDELSGPLQNIEIKKIEAVHGGCIHKSWKIHSQDGSLFFAKTCDKRNYAMLEFENDGLIKLGSYVEKSELQIPQPFICKKLNHISILLLPWFNIFNGNQQQLGKGLASLHLASSKNSLGKFGWDKEGFIGLGPQTKGWNSNWGEFFVNRRLIPQLQLTKKWGLHLTKYEKLLEKLIPLLNEHDPIPSLVHGDLWSGNVGTNENDQGIIFDPAIYWADREVDIAMTKLFGGFSIDFFDGYNEIWKLKSCFCERVEIYNLYHVINHANMFGGTYKNEAVLILEKLKDQLNC